MQTLDHHHHLDALEVLSPDRFSRRFLEFMNSPKNPMSTVCEMSPTIHHDFSVDCLALASLTGVHCSKLRR